MLLRHKKTKVGQWGHTQPVMTPHDDCEPLAWETWQSVVNVMLAHSCSWELGLNRCIRKAWIKGMKKLAPFVLWRKACKGNDYSQWTPNNHVAASLQQRERQSSNMACFHSLMFCSTPARERERGAIERAFINASFVRHARWKLMKVFMRGSDVISITSGNKMEN